MPIIETAGLTKRYPGVVALDDLTVAIEPGIVGLVGANGAGKSTLIKLLLGLLEPTSGSARVLGFDVARERLELRRRVGYLPEHDCLPPDVSATEFVAHMGQLSGLPRGAARERTADVLRHVGLFEERYRPMGSYSTGMRQRAKLAQALVHDPQLLFLDEPTNGLDPVAREEMLRLIDELPAKRGCTVVLSTHLLPDVERLCDAVVVMHQGRLLYAGSIAALRGAADGRYEVRVKDGANRLADALRAAGCQVEPVLGGALAVTLAAGLDTDAIFRAARGAGVQVRHLAPLQVTLEAAFLRTLEAA